MIRAYDEYGNVVDMVKYESKIYNQALNDLWSEVIKKYDYLLDLEDLDGCIDELKRREGRK